MSKLADAHSIIDKLQEILSAPDKIDLVDDVITVDVIDQLNGVDEAAFEQIFSDLQGGLDNIRNRCRRLALALRAVGEYRLQSLVWDCAIRHGMDVGNGCQRIQEARFAANDLTGAIVVSGRLIALGKHGGLLGGPLRDVVKRYVSDGSAGDIAGHLRMVSDNLGFDYAEDHFVELAKAGRVDGEALAALMKGAGPDAAIRIAVIARRFSLPLDSSSLAEIAGQGDVVRALVDAQACLHGHDRAGALSALDAVSPADVIDSPDMKVVAHWALVAAVVAHPTLSDACARVAGDGDFVSALRLWQRSAVEPEDMWLAYDALSRAGGDRRALDEAVLEVGMSLSDDLAKEVLETVYAETSEPRDQKVIKFARIVVESPKVSASFASLFCSDNFATLSQMGQGASLCARAFSASGDWRRSLQALDALCTLSQDPPWAVGRSYMLAARLGERDRAAQYIAKLDFDSPAVTTAMLSVANGAVILGDFAFGRRALARIAGGRSEQDPHNLRGRLHAVLTGSPDLLADDDKPRGPGLDRTPKMLLIDPGFSVNSGHHVGYSQFAVEFFSKELDIPRDHILFVTGRSNVGEASRLPAELRLCHYPAFDFSPYIFEEFPKYKETLDNLSEVWRQDLHRAFDGADLGSVEVIYFHSMKANLIVGFARWLKDNISSFPRGLLVVLGVIEVDYLTEGEETRKVCDKNYFDGVEIIKSLSGVDLVLYAETKYACDHLTGVFGDLTDVHTIPYLAASLAGDGRSTPLALSDDTITIGLVGGSRLERGVDIFPELILSFCEHPQIRWIIQLDRSFAAKLDPVFPLYLEWAVKEKLCVWYDGRIETDEYYDALRRMDVVLMPYRERYAVSGSGVFYEAMQLQRLLMVPERTFMAEAVEELEYPAILLNGTSLKAVRKSIKQMLDSVDTMRSRMSAFRSEDKVTLPLDRFRSLVARADRAELLV